MTANLSETNLIREQFRFVLVAQRARRGLVIITLGFVVIGLLEFLHGVTDFSQSHGEHTAPHPVASICLAAFAAVILMFRRGVRPPWWCNLIVICGMCIAGLHVLFGHQPAFETMYGKWFYGEMGRDTAIILTCLFASFMLRHRAGRLGMAMALVALIVMVNTYVGESYGVRLFVGHMPHSTMFALLPATLAMLTLYAHRPFVRVMLASTRIGRRTRQMVTVGFVTPWFCGLMLYRVYGVTERDYPIEAIIMTVIMWSMFGVAVYSGFLSEAADRLRRAAERDIRRFAVEDQLTGILNRNGLMQELSVAWTQFVRHRAGYAIVLMDLDHFKVINDTYGHGEGDRVLATVREVMGPHLNNAVVFGRWGGEEFLMVIADGSIENLREISENLRRAVQEIPNVLARTGLDEPITYTVTGSFGVSRFAGDDVGFSEAIKRADDALYHAKRSGRNCVSFDPRTLMIPAA